MTHYLTPAQHGEAEFTERGSRFIGDCAPAADEQSAKDFLSAVRETYPGATHYVYAYRLKNGVSRFSDDGEPSGTAGAPVFEALNRREVFDAVIVVTRFFGGTLLGAGGLVRAYARAASMSLEAAGIAELCPWFEGTASVSYAQYDQVTRLLAAHGARAVEPVFGADILLRFQLPEEAWEPVAAALRELTAGGTIPLRGGAFYGRHS